MNKITCVIFTQSSSGLILHYSRWKINSKFQQNEMAVQHIILLIILIRVRIRVSVRIRIRVRVRFSFSGANLNRKTLGGELLPELRR